MPTGTCRPVFLRYIDALPFSVNPIDPVFCRNTPVAIAFKKASEGVAAVPSINCTWLGITA